MWFHKYYEVVLHLILSCYQQMPCTVIDIVILSANALHGN